MRILFWEEMQDDKFWDILSPEEEIALKAIWEGLYDRLFILDQEIQGEENTNEFAAVIVYLNKKAIQAKNYSPLLTSKINDRLDDKSVKSILQRTQHALYRLLN